MWIKKDSLMKKCGKDIEFLGKKIIEIKDSMNQIRHIVKSKTRGSPRQKKETWGAD